MPDTTVLHNFLSWALLLSITPYPGHYCPPLLPIPGTIALSFFPLLGIIVLHDSLLRALLLYYNLFWALSPLLFLLGTLSSFFVTLPGHLLFCYLLSGFYRPITFFSGHYRPTLLCSGTTFVLFFNHDTVIMLSPLPGIVILSPTTRALLPTVIPLYAPFPSIILLRYYVTPFGRYLVRRSIALKYYTIHYLHANLTLLFY